MKIRFKFFLFILFITAKLAAQDITGLWKGEMYVDSVKLHLPYEILISNNNGKLTGYSRVIFFKDGVQGGIEEPGIQDIIIKQNGDRITIDDEGFLEHNFSIKPPKQVKKTMVLTLIVSDTDMVMKGSWSTNRTKYYLVATGTATLKRKNDYKTTALYKRLDTLKLTSKLTINLPVYKQVPIVAVNTVPVIKNELPRLESTLPEPALVIPAIDKVTFSVIPILKKQQPSIATIKAPSLLQKAFYKSITTTKLIYVPKEEPAVAKIEKSIAPSSTPKPKPETLTLAIPIITQKKETISIVTAATKPKSIAAAIAPAKNNPSSTVAIAPAPAPKSKPVALPVPATTAVIAKVMAPENKPVVNTPITALSKTEPIPVALIAPSETQGAAELDKRTILSEQSFFFESDSLVLTLYDNGDVDGDTVTVVMNGNVIFSKQGLSTRANTKTIQISPTADSIKLVMYAENLGEIPPNTGLLVVMDGEKRYDVRFAADLKSNAAIVLKRRKKQ